MDTLYKQVSRDEARNSFKDYPLNDGIPPPHCPAIKDSGERRVFDSGAVRDVASGKGRFDLLPWRALTLAAQQMERGAAKYEARNWEQGMPLGEYLNSMMRHLREHQLRNNDEPHLAAFVWNALAYAETAERIRLGILPEELDNRPDFGLRDEEKF